MGKKSCTGTCLSLNSSPAYQLITYSFFAPLRETVLISIPNLLIF